MNAPVDITAARIARQQQQQTNVPQKASPPVSSALLDLIDSCTPAEPCFRAPNATRNLDDEQEIVIDPSAPMLDFDEKKQVHERKRAKKKRDAKSMAKALQVIKPAINERAKKVPAAHMEEVYELVRLHGPLTSREAVIRMERCGYPRSSTLRALDALVGACRIASTVIHPSKGDPPVLVYEVHG